MGLTRTDGGIHVSAVAAAKACSLLLFVKEDKNGKEARFREVRNIPFPEEGKTGHVWSMTLNGAFDDLYYAFEADGKRFSDPYGRSFAGRERWGRLSHAKRLLLTPVAEPEFDWQGDRPLHIPYEDCIVYRAHVRGLTKHASSGTEHRGTFRGVVDKIPYFKELGITTLELLPPVEFQEVMMPENVEGNPYGMSEPTGRLNYWGYAKAGFTDTWRYFYPDQAGVYSWWSYRFKAREKNAGWRIDYFCVSDCLKDRLESAKIHTEVPGSDHCPVELCLKE